MKDDHAALLQPEEWKKVREIFMNALGLGPVDWGDDALGLQYDDAPSPHAKNVDVRFDGTQVTVKFYGGSEKQRSAVLTGSTQGARALGVTLTWTS